MFKKLAFVGAASMIAFSAYAVTEMDVRETVQLTDGSTLYVFKDGKMGMANRYGHAVLMPEQSVIEAPNGRSVQLRRYRPDRRRVSCR